MRTTMQIERAVALAVTVGAAVSVLFSLGSCGASSGDAGGSDSDAMISDRDAVVMDGTASDAGFDSPSLPMDAAVESSDSSSVVDAPTTMDSGPGCRTDAGDACNAPTECGPVVAVVPTIQAAPTPTGGTIVPGLYFLTAVNWYTSAVPDASAGTIQETLLLTSNMVGVRAFSDGYEAPPAGGSYAATGTSVTWMYSCPSASQQVQAYSATSTTFTVYEQPSGTSDVYEFISTKQ